MIPAVKRIFLWVSSIAASLVAIAVVLQLYLIAAWVFGESDALDAHRGVGRLVWLLEIVVLIAGLVAYWGAWRQIGVSASLLVLGTIQIGFVGDLEDPGSGWAHGLHGGLAVFVFLLALWIGCRDLPRRTPGAEIAA
jgi:hypothetical protein